MAKQAGVKPGDVLSDEYWGDLKGMTVEEWGQREYELGRKSGMASGIDAASELVMEQAASMFRKGDDHRAELLREIAREIAEKTKITLKL